MRNNVWIAKFWAMALCTMTATPVSASETPDEPACTQADDLDTLMNKSANFIDNASGSALEQARDCNDLAKALAQRLRIHAPFIDYNEGLIQAKSSKPYTAFQMLERIEETVRKDKRKIQDELDIATGIASTRPADLQRMRNEIKINEDYLNRIQTTKKEALDLVPKIKLIVSAGIRNVEGVYITRNGIDVPREFWNDGGDGRNAKFILVDPGSMEFVAWSPAPQPNSKPIMRSAPQRVEANIQKVATVKIDGPLEAPRLFSVGGYDNFMSEMKRILDDWNGGYTREKDTARYAEAIRKRKMKNPDAEIEDQILSSSPGDEEEKTKRQLSCYGTAHGDLEAIINFAYENYRMAEPKLQGDNDSDEIKWLRHVINYKIKPCLKGCLAGEREPCDAEKSHLRIWSSGCRRCSFSVSNSSASDTVGLTASILALSATAFRTRRRRQASRRMALPQAPRLSPYHGAVPENVKIQPKT